MNSKMHLQSYVLAERRQGASLGDLALKYKISKSTVSLWCREMKLSKKAKQLISENWLEKTTSARKKGALKNKQKRADRIEREYTEAVKVIKNLGHRDLLIMGVGLYWAEGSKKETGSGFSFVNSDHFMIKVMYEWLLHIIKIRKDQLILNVSINISHKERESEILKFWSNLLDFSIEDFGNTNFIKTPHLRVYKNHSNYFGMLRIKVKSSSWLRRRILGMIKVFVDKYAGVAQVVRANPS